MIGLFLLRLLLHELITCRLPQPHSPPLDRLHHSQSHQPTRQTLRPLNTIMDFPFASIPRYDDTSTHDINLPHPLLTTPPEHFILSWSAILSRITLFNLRFHTWLRLWAFHAYLKLVARTLPLLPWNNPSPSAHDLTHSTLLPPRLRIRILLQHRLSHLVHHQYGSVLLVIYPSPRSTQSFRPFIASSSHRVINIRFTLS